MSFRSSEWGLNSPSLTLTSKAALDRFLYSEIVLLQLEARSQYSAWHIICTPYQILLYNLGFVFCILFFFFFFFEAHELWRTMCFCFSRTDVHALITGQHFKNGLGGQEEEQRGSWVKTSADGKRLWRSIVVSLIYEHLKHGKRTRVAASLSLTIRPPLSSQSLKRQIRSWLSSA